MLPINLKSIIRTQSPSNQKFLNFWTDQGIVLAALPMEPETLTILHIASHHGVFRGGAVQLCRMALEQKKRGHMVHVIAHAGKPGLSDREKEQAGNSWAILRDAGISVEILSYIPWSGRLELRRRIQRLRPDVVHVHRDEALVAAWWATWGMKKPILVAQRGTIRHSEPPARRALRSSRTKAIIAVSQAVRQAVLESGGERAHAKTHVVYGSVDLAQFAPHPPEAKLKEKAGCPPDAIVIGSLSAYRRAKGFDVLLEGLRAAFEKHPKAHALFLGKGVEHNVKPMAVRLGIAGRCHFMGHQANVADWLSIMDITAIAAGAREGLSGVLRESLAMEIPVISTDCAGNNEIVYRGETGLLVPIGNKEAMAEAFLWALAHPEEMRAMARAGRRWVEENCSLATQCGHLEKIYRNALRTL